MNYSEFFCGGERGITRFTREKSSNPRYLVGTIVFKTCKDRKQKRATVFTIALSFAEREGFEPPVPCGYNSFQDYRIRPLCHLSLCGPPKAVLQKRVQIYKLSLIFNKISVFFTNCYITVKSIASAHRPYKSLTISYIFQNPYK